MVRSWEDLRAPFQRIVFSRMREKGSHHGVREIAAEIPAGRSTVYRLISGGVETPRTAVLACIDRFVAKNLPNVTDGLRPVGTTELTVDAPENRDERP